MNTHLKLLLSGAAISCLMLPAPVFAQTASDTSANDYEVTVTARKREESLTEVPVSISVLNEALIEDTGILTQADLFSLVPGIQYDETLDRNSAAPSIRGVQTNEVATNRTKVTQFIDGMPVLGSQGNVQFGGVQQVEVFRGPQSAAFGRSTFGGAINYVTKDPGDEFAANAGFQLDDYGTRRVNAAIEGPITDTLSFLISGEIEDSTSPDEFIASDGSHWGERSSESLAGKLVWEPTDALTAEFAATWVKSEDEATVAYFIDQDAFNACWDGSEAGGMGGGPNSIGQTDCDWSQGAPIVSQIDRTQAVIAGLAAGTFNGFGTITDTSDQTYQDLVFLADAQSITAEQNGSFDERTRFSAQIDYAFDHGGLAQFSAFTGEEEYIRITDNEQDARAIDLIQDNGTDFYEIAAGMGAGTVGTFMADPSEIEELYLEARYVSPGEDRLRYVVGASYYDYTFKTDLYFGGYTAVLDGTTDRYDQLVGNYYTVDVGRDSFLADANGDRLAVNDEYTYENGLINGIIDPSKSVGTPNQIFAETATNSGIYGNVSYDFTDRLTGTLEGRFQRDEVGGTNELTGVSQSVTTESFLPRLSVNYNIDDSTSVYAQYARGNNPAGFNSGFLDEIYQETLNCAAFDYATLNDGTNRVVDLDGNVLLDAAGNDVVVTNPGEEIAYITNLDGSTDVQGGTAGDGVYTNTFLNNAAGSDVPCGSNFVDYDASSVTSFKEETIDNFEIGAKGQLFDGALTFATAIFYMEWKDQIQTVNIDWTDPEDPDAGGDYGGQRSALNQGDITMKGVELEATANLTDDFSVRGTLSYLDATYADFCSQTLVGSGYEQEEELTLTREEALERGYAFECVDVTGKQVVQQSPWTASFSPSYRTELSNGLGFNARSDIRYEGAQYLDTINQWEAAPVTTVNVSSGLTGEKWGLTLFVNNLFDEDQPSRYGTGDDFSSDPLNELDNFYITPRQQRTIGLRGNVRY